MPRSRRRQWIDVMDQAAKELFFGPVICTLQDAAFDKDGICWQRTTAGEEEGMAWPLFFGPAALTISVCVRSGPAHGISFPSGQTVAYPVVDTAQ
jgi:hypothetical protein